VIYHGLIHSKDSLPDNGILADDGLCRPSPRLPVKEVFQKAPGAKNDIYGSLFLCIQDLLSQFCHRIKGLKICFQLCQVDALKLPGILRQGGIDKHYFDRIEV